MISFSQKGTHVQVDINAGTESPGTCRLSWTCTHPMYAELLYERFAKEYGDRIEALGKAMYEQGWKDAKAKKKGKKDWFLRWLPKLDFWE